MNVFIFCLQTMKCTKLNSPQNIQLYGTITTICFEKDVIYDFKSVHALLLQSLLRDNTMELYSIITVTI